MQDFERDPTIAELLTPDQLGTLGSLLSSLAGAELSVTDASQQAGGAPVEFNLETIGWVQGLAPDRTKASAARMTAFIAYFAAKYRMAANLHRSTTEASYEELRRQNEALKASERQLNELANSLQERVDRQVEVIRVTQQKLYESNRLRSVGQLAAGVAHEINNPIGFIKSNLSVAREYVDELASALPDSHDLNPTLEDFRALLAESLAGAQRIAAIVADLKTFSNIDQAEYALCSVNDLIESAIHLVRTNHHSGLVIHTSLDAGLPMVHGHGARLSQVFYNVLDNAALATHDGGTVSIESDRSASGAIRIQVTDSGCGVADSDLKQVFEPFFTTRPVGSGTGLGLTVARDIVAAHRGKITFESQSGEGSRVSIVLPVQEE